MKKEIFKGLSYLRIKTSDKLFFGNININSFFSKFDQLKLLIRITTESIIDESFATDQFLTDSKIDEGFPTDQFLTDGFAKPFRLDINKSGGGVLIHKNIPSKPIKTNSISSDTESIFLELNLINYNKVVILWVVLSTNST